MQSPEQSQFVLAPPSVLRPLAAAAAAAVVGALLLLAAGGLGWPRWVVWAGAVVMVIAALVAGATMLVSSRLRAVLHLDPEGLTVARGGRRTQLPWSEIDRIDLQGPRLAVTARDGRVVSVLNPGQVDDPAFVELVQTLQRRLDADRGYHTPG